MTLHHHSKAISALAALPVIAHGAFGGDEGATDSGIWKVRGEDLYIVPSVFVSYLFILALFGDKWMICFLTAE